MLGWPDLQIIYPLLSRMRQVLWMTPPTIGTPGAGFDLNLLGVGELVRESRVLAGRSAWGDTMHPRCAIQALHQNARFSPPAPQSDPSQKPKGARPEWAR